MKTRDDFHKLIDTIEDDRVLQSYYQMVSMLQQNKENDLWDSLSKNEQAELLISYEESFSEKNLLSHNVVMEKHLKWRKK